ncbi:glycosyltransferase family 2 protein [Roseateles puraquae]|uniref:Dolichol monophosphate mannose synthase n=1 Tax=Roseateles puraquae TaxID=431059 RepID=A0A254N880_9BURK|nr:glycosyltransferase family 2 protein [Roseateles puraquae]MDG0852373.1 glycosyltransferase family 2 protein [Roseateles puraquae]OWR04221.1 dolichol monophosphate mannose synthase [Roseateles puraquae]
MTSPRPPAVQLSIVIPTFNERGNIAELVRRIDNCMGDTPWEVVYVDDNSPDGTAAAVRELAQTDGRVRLVHRIGRRGLSSACIEGMLASTAPFIAVMDADLQHDETLLPHMLAALRNDGLDVVVGSRHADGGSLGDWDAGRAKISDVATRLAKLVTQAELRDPMSGFFMLRREVLYEAMPKLSAIGFKILLDIFASVPRPLKFKELGYTFRNRFSGESKLDSMVAWEYLMMLLDKRVGHIVPVRFVPFAAIGAAGVVVHMIVLWLMFKSMGQSFAAGQTLATLIAMTANFFFNNAFTYRDRRLKGWGLLRGWLSFTLACSLGAVANVGIATYLFRENTADWALAALSGIVVGAVWNYAVTSVYTWGKPKAA